MSQSAPNGGYAPGSQALHGDSALSERDQNILALERHWWKYAGAKDEAIRQNFAIAPTHYYQLLNTLIDTDNALAYDPVLVKRLRRLRDTRRRAVSARRIIR